MERMLLKMAQQLNAYDEASLMSLWDKYAEIVDGFEPSKRWEEAALVFSLVQAVRWKNQLFNLRLAEAARPSGQDGAPLPGFDQVSGFLQTHGAAHDSAIPAGEGAARSKKRCKVLRFNRRKGDKPV